MEETIKCLACPKTASSHSGHVHKGKRVLLAGWCREHSLAKTSIVMPRAHKYCRGKGCFGKWDKRYGLG